MQDLCLVYKNIKRWNVLANEKNTLGQWSYMDILSQKYQMMKCVPKYALYLGSCGSLRPKISNDIYGFLKNIKKINVKYEMNTLGHKDLSDHAPSSERFPWGIPTSRGSALAGACMLKGYQSHQNKNDKNNKQTETQTNKQYTHYKQYKGIPTLRGSALAGACHVKRLVFLANQYRSHTRLKQF